MSKIGYSELSKCIRLAEGNDSLVSEVSVLCKQARFSPSVDFTYELIEVLNKYSEDESANTVRQAFWPSPEYDPAREA